MDELTMMLWTMASFSFFLFAAALFEIKWAHSALQKLPAAPRRNVRR